MIKILTYLNQSTMLNNYKTTFYNNILQFDVSTILQNYFIPGEQNMQFNIVPRNGFPKESKLNFLF